MASSSSGVSGEHVAHLQSVQTGPDVVRRKYSMSTPRSIDAIEEADRRGALPMRRMIVEALTRETATPSKVYPSAVFPRSL